MLFRRFIFSGLLVGSFLFVGAAITKAQNAIVLSLPTEVRTRITELSEEVQLFDLKKLSPNQRDLFRNSLKAKAIPFYEHGFTVVAGSGLALVVLKDIFQQAEDIVEPEVYESFWGFVSFAAEREISFIYKHRFSNLASFSKKLNRISFSMPADLSPAVFVHEVVHAINAEVMNELVVGAYSNELPMIYELFGRQSRQDGLLMTILDEALAWKVAGEFEEKPISWQEIQELLSNRSYVQRFGIQAIQSFFEIWTEERVEPGDLRKISEQSLQMYSDMSLDELIELGHQSIIEQDTQLQWNFMKIFMFQIGRMSPEEYRARSEEIVAALEILAVLSMQSEKAIIQEAALDFIEAIEGRRVSSDVRSQKLAFLKKETMQWRQRHWGGELIGVSDQILPLLYYMDSRQVDSLTEALLELREAQKTPLMLTDEDRVQLGEILSMPGIHLREKIKAWIEEKNSLPASVWISELEEHGFERSAAWIAKSHIESLSAKEVERIAQLLDRFPSESARQALSLLRQLLDYHGFKAIAFSFDRSIRRNQDKALLQSIDRILSKILDLRGLNLVQAELLTEAFARFLPSELPLFRNSLLQGFQSKPLQPKSRLPQALFEFRSDQMNGAARWVYWLRSQFEDISSAPAPVQIGLTEFHRTFTPLLLSSLDPGSSEQISLLKTAISDLETLVDNEDPTVIRNAFFASFGSQDYLKHSSALSEEFEKRAGISSFRLSPCKSGYEAAAQKRL